MTEHTSRHYERELQTLKEKILLLGGKVEEMIGSAMRSLLDREPDLAERVIASDRFTIGPYVAAFEDAFAAYHRRQYCVMVNSGSSANLLT